LRPELEKQKLIGTKKKSAGSADESKSNRNYIYIVPGLLVGTGIDQQPHTVRVTPVNGTRQRRKSVLRVEFASTRTVNSQSP
jgi:hypothetical protein